MALVLITSSSCLKILKEVVIRRSGNLQRSEPVEKSSLKSDITASPQHSPARTPHPKLRTLTHIEETYCTLDCHEKSQLSSPCPLFSPTTLIVEDSIISVFSMQPHTASLEPRSLTSWIMILTAFLTFQIVAESVFLFLVLSPH